jgi:DNA helicase TIP49 (TBP-interacting protein)
MYRISGVTISETYQVIEVEIKPLAASTQQQETPLFSCNDISKQMQLTLSTENVDDGEASTFTT